MLRSFCTKLLLINLPVIAGLLALPLRASSDDTASPQQLVNLDGPATAAKGTLAGSLDIRFFVRPEDIVYTSLGIRYGLLPKLEIGFRGTTAATKGLAIPAGSTIFHGGRDAEFYGKFNAGSFRSFNFAVLGGVSLPATPAQNQAAGTVSATASIDVRRFTLYLNPRAVFPDGNSIVGIGVGGSWRLTDRVRVVGDWTGIVSGDNTRDTASGTRKRGDIWGVALRFSSLGNGTLIDMDLGYGNATGSTTGFSLTPGLGNSSGFYFALRARR